MEMADCIINKASDIDLAVSAYQEFSDAADYIWKAPRLLDQERKDELGKLKVYFPDSQELAERRWHHESRKLDSTFPYLMNNGNLFSVASLYEAYLILLANDLEKITGIGLVAVRGQGNSRLSNYFKCIGMDCSKVELNHQIDAALRIRNCLVHASGVLAWSKDEKGLRQITKSGTFLSKDHRERRIKNGSNFDEVKILRSSLGDRVQITNEYAWLCSVYFRDYFIGLCIQAREFEKGKI